MLNKRMKLLATTLGLVTLLATFASCSQRNPDINRIVDPYWEKEYFSPEDTWYYRMTIVDGAPGAGMWGAIGEGHWLLLERLRWEVTETALIGWRDYEAAPGTEDQQWDQGSELYKGAAVAIFPIFDHFDIVRNYNPATGEQGNVIAENRADRVWYERSYMRVDWSRNFADMRNFNLFRIPIAQVADSFVVQPNDLGDPKRFRFEDDYFETTTRSQFMPDLYGVFGFYGEGYFFDTAAQMIDFRHSFKKRTADNDQHEIVHMPPSVVLTDENGTEQLDEDGFSKRELIADRFGIFSTFGRQAWDPNRGFNDPNAQWHATVFNIWQATKNADGTEIPMEERETKPIEYWTNVTHPQQLLSASINRVGGEWNRVFKNVVFNAQPGKYTSADDVPDMFIVHENSCNPANVESVMSGLRADLVDAITLAAAELDFDGTIQSAKAMYDEANSPDNNAPFTQRSQQETQALENTERICSALEYYTNPLNSADPSIEPFQYQRVGDVRYNMLNLIMKDHHAGWLGYGPMLGDPVTGETIQATANIAMVLMDQRIARFTQQMDETNGLIDFTDLVFGFDIQRYIAEKLQEGQQLTSFKPSAELMANMDGRFAGMREGQRQGREILRESSPREMESRLERAIGTRAEELLVGEQDFLLMNALGTPLSDEGTLDEAILDNTSPLRAQARSRRADKHEEFLMRQGHFAMDSIEIIDRFTFGLANEFKDIADPRERFEKLREEVYVGVQLHEVGHNVGLLHNFEASTDALNYGERFWELQALPADMATAAGSVDDPEQAEKIQSCITQQNDLNQRYGLDLNFTTQECLKQTESMISTVMEYTGQWNGRFGGLGPYDEAAIAFTYGKLLRVFDDDALAMDPRNTDVKKWTYYNDWRDIAGEVAVDHEAVNRRSWVKYEWGPATTSMETPANAVPFRFNPGFPPTPWAQAFDTGPDMRTNAAFLKTWYYQYYFWSHFSRNRLDDTGTAINRAVNSDALVLFDFTRKMQWYYFLKATDPDFEGSYAEQDFLSTTIIGLNHFQHVIGHPRSGRFVNVDNYNISGLINKPLAEIDRLAPSDIMVQWSNLGNCTSRTLANNDGDQPRPGHRVSDVNLGDGRPFFLGFTDDYEDFFVTYMGTYFTKNTALQMLGYNFAFFPGVTNALDPRVFNISWYRLFPDEVGKLMHDLIADEYQNLGPVVDAEGNYSPRDILDPETGLAPDYEGFTKVLPTISFQHQYFGALIAMALMSSPWDDEVDMTKNFKMAVEGAEDDFGAFDRMRDEAIAAGLDPDEAVSEFVHPLSGQRMRGLKLGENSIGYSLVERLNFLKERFLRLEACVNDPDGLAQTDEYCSCVSSLVAVTTPNGDVQRFCSVAADGSQRPDVPGPTYYEAPGQGECSFTDLQNRRDAARENMDDILDFSNNLRQFYQIFSEL